MAEDSSSLCGALDFVTPYEEAVDSSNPCGSQGCGTPGAAGDSWTPAWLGGFFAALDSWTCPGSQDYDFFLWVVGSCSWLCRDSSACLSLDSETACVNHSWEEVSPLGCGSLSEDTDSCWCCACPGDCVIPSWVVDSCWRIF